MIERSTAGSLLRCAQAYVQQICDKQTLECGIAYFSTRFPALPEANQFREIVADTRERILAAVEEGCAWFARHGLNCRVMAPALDQSIPDFEKVLAAHGFTPRKLTTLRLARWNAPAASSNVRVLPARAMRAALSQTFLHDPAVPSDRRAAAAAAFTERLDDAALDAFVAVVQGQPAGRCALHQVGDLAQFVEFSVLPSDAAREVESALLHHVLALARRLALRHVLAAIDAAQPQRRDRLIEVGFESDGEILEFHAAPRNLVSRAP